jgi:hypothetical protein
MPFTLTPAEKDAAMTTEVLRTPRATQRRHPGRAALACAAVLLATAGATLAGVTPASALTPGRHYEQISPVDKAGQGTTAATISPDGRHAVLDTGPGNALPGFESFRPFGNVMLAARGGAAWQAAAANTSATTSAFASFSDVSRDGTAVLTEERTYEQNANHSFDVLRYQAGGPFESLTGVLTYLQDPYNFALPFYNGATPDLSHVLLWAAPQLTLRPQDPVSAGGVLYHAFRSPSGEAVLDNVGADLHNPGVDGNGDPLETCYALDVGGIDLAGTGYPNGQHALSDDGQTVFFSASPECGQRHLYARLHAQSTVELSVSECTRQADPGASPPVPACSTTPSAAYYADASTDGRRVFFASEAQLTDTDVDATADLYEYDFARPAGHRLRQISGGATPGTGAAVQGFVAASDDGLRAYFGAQGVLTTQPNGLGQTARAGANNLYRWDAAGNRTTFVTTLSPADQPWLSGFKTAVVRGETDQYLVFSSTEQLTADDTDTAADVYRYDVASQVLQRISIGQDGYGSDGNDNALGAAIRNNSQAFNRQALALAQSVSADGSRIVFVTAQALAPQDVNGLEDVYEWHDGRVDLISDGRDPAGSSLAMISADGSTVVFKTQRKLVPGDTDTAVDVYAARLGEDFPPAPASPAPPCTGDVCQGRPTAQAPLASAGTVAFAGAGNAAITRGPTKRSVTVTVPKAISGSQAVLTVKAPAAGALTLSGSGLRSVRRSARAGAYRIAVRLTAAGVRSFKKHHRYTTTARVVFTPADGTSSTARVKLTFKAPATAKGR